MEQALRERRTARNLVFEKGARLKITSKLKTNATSQAHCVGEITNMDWRVWECFKQAKIYKIILPSHVNRLYQLVLGMQAGTMGCMTFKLYKKSKAEMI